MTEADHLYPNFIPFWIWIPWCVNLPAHILSFKDNLWSFLGIYIMIEEKFWTHCIFFVMIDSECNDIPFLHNVVKYCLCVYIYVMVLLFSSMIIIFLFDLLAFIYGFILVKFTVANKLHVILILYALKSQFYVKCRSW